MINYHQSYIVDCATSVLLQNTQPIGYVSFFLPCYKVLVAEGASIFPLTLNFNTERRLDVPFRFQVKWIMKILTDMFLQIVV